MTILGQDFYTAHNTVKDVAQSVAIGQEVDRKKNLMGSLNDLYQQKPNASLEDLRAQYAVYGTPEDLVRMDEKIYTRDLTKAGQKFGFYQNQLNFAKESQDAPAQQAIVASMNNDPEIAKFIGDVQITPTGTYQFTATNKMKFPNPANPKEMVDILPGDIYQINQNNQLTKVNSQYRQAMDLANLKASQKLTLKMSGTYNDPRLKGAFNEIARVAETTDPAQLPGFIDSVLSRPELANVNPSELANFHKDILTQIQAGKQTGLNATVGFTGKQETPTGAPAAKKVARTGKTKDGKTVIEYTDGTREYR